MWIKETFPLKSPAPDDVLLKNDSLTHETVKSDTVVILWHEISSLSDMEAI